MSTTQMTIVTSVLGFFTAVTLALVNSWISARAGVDENLRAQRLERYPALWNSTGAISRWPRVDVTRGSLEKLHETLRSWYYAGGGLFLSESARARYGNVQELIEAMLSHKADPDCRLAEDAYTALMETASALRTALSEDLNTRRRELLRERWRRARRHAAAARKAAERIELARESTAAFTPKEAVQLK
jgi:hypothetical protein